MANAGLCCPFPGDEKLGMPYMRGLVSRYALPLCSIAFQENYGFPRSARLPTSIAVLLSSIKHAGLLAFVPLRLLRPQRKLSYRLRQLKNSRPQAGGPLEQGGMPARADMRHHRSSNQKPHTFLRRSHHEPQGTAVVPGAHRPLCPGGLCASVGHTEPAGLGGLDHALPEGPPPLVVS